MQLLSYFIRKYRFFLFFIVLELLSLYLIIQNHSFHKSKFVTSANTITGGFYNKVSNIQNFFSLSEKNIELQKENTELKQRIEDFTLKTNNVIDSLNYLEKKYIYNFSKIVKNSYQSNYNFLLINSGIRDSIQSEMAVVNGKGIIGVTEKSSNNYTRVQSILNMETKINAKLKNSNFFGTLTWDGKDYKIVQLIDIEKQAPVKVGDTIVTGGMSAIFPENIPIGTVKKFNRSTTTSSSIDIKLFNDMSNVRYVYIIKNNHQEEIRELIDNNE